MKKLRVLASVNVKAGLLDFLAGLNIALSRYGKSLDVLATRGTVNELQKHHFPVTTMSEFTGQPEILGGRLSSVHPWVHAGLAAYRTDEIEELKSLGIPLIDLLILNLFPLGEETSSLDGQFDSAGLALLDAASERVTVVVDPMDYLKVMRNIEEHGEVPEWERWGFFRKAQDHAAAYHSKAAKFYLHRRYGLP